MEWHIAGRLCVEVVEGLRDCACHNHKSSYSSFSYALSSVVKFCGTHSSFNTLHTDFKLSTHVHCHKYLCHLVEFLELGQTRGR